MVATRRIRDVLETSPSGFSYGHTYSGYPMGCAVGCAVVDVIEEEGLVEAAAVKGDRIRSDLEELQARHPLIHSLRGRGLLQGIELRDPSGARFPAARDITGAVTSAARERELMVYACPTPVGTEHMDALLLAPPMIIRDAEIAEMIEKLDGALQDVEQTL
jgi:hypothetical protein